MREIISGVVGGVLTAFFIWLAGSIWKWPGTVLVPPMAVVPFNLEKCPAGWREFIPMRGRYVVGAEPGPNVGKSVGIQLKALEDRPTGQHDHQFNDASLGGHNVNGLGAGGYERFRLSTFRTELSDGAASISGTNAPYVSLLFCEKN